jgi:uncharacterized protein YjbJ (UPF0337 family)
LYIKARPEARLLRHLGVVKIEQTAANRSANLMATLTPQLRMIGWSEMGFPAGLFLAHTRQEMETRMKPSTTDQVQGALHEVKGEVKEKAGQVTGNPDLTSEGQAEKLAGKVQKKVGQVEKVFEQ